MRICDHQRKSSYNELICDHQRNTLTMQTQEALKTRRSCRGFNSKAIQRNFIEILIDCARFAPTARNVQPWEFIALTKKETLQALADLADNGKFIKECSCCIAVFCKETKYYLEDGCAATLNILTAAADLGLSSCWVAGDKKAYAQKIQQLLGVPEGFLLVSLIALGYSDLPALSPEKRALKDVLHYEKF